MPSDLTPTLSTEFLEDPILFTSFCWPELTLYPKQKEILYSLRDNIQTFVHAGNELGKDFISGVAIPWFFASRSPAKVITSSSGETQLKSVLWGEIRKRISTSRIKFPWAVSHLNIKQLDENGIPIPLCEIIGHVTKSVENFQGHHLEHDIPRVLFVADEASGIGDEFWEASQSWFHRALVIGNPLNTTNFFFRECKKGDTKDPANPKGKSLLRKVIHIGAEHSPNVQLGKELVGRGYEGDRGWPNVIPGVLSYPEYLRRKVQWDPIKQSMRLDGHFYEGQEALLYPPEWYDLCEAKYKTMHGTHENGEGYHNPELRLSRRTPVSMGIDPGAGGDPTCWTIIDTKGLIFQHEEVTPDTSVITDTTMKFIRDFRLVDKMVAIDLGGGGKQIADQLKRFGYSIRTIPFGGAASRMQDKAPPRKRTAKVEIDARRQAYKNRRCEMYGLLRDLMNPSLNPNLFALPEELHELRRELIVHPLWYDEHGRMYLPSKDRPPHKKKETDEVTIKKLLEGKSPNRADSLVLAVFAMQMPLVRKKIGAV